MGPNTRLIVYDDGVVRGRAITVRNLFDVLSGGLAAWRQQLDAWRDTARDALIDHNQRINANAQNVAANTQAINTNSQNIATNTQGIATNGQAIAARALTPIRVDRDLNIAGAQAVGKKSINVAVAGVVAGELIVANMRAGLPAQMMLGGAFSTAVGQVTVTFAVFAAVTNPAGTVAAVTISALR